MRMILRTGNSFPLRGQDRVMLQITIGSSGQLDLESSNSFLNRTAKKRVKKRTKRMDKHLGANCFGIQSSIREHR